ncbi:MAG TPA: hypothetical protein VGO07_04270, partial [Candidatus Saccharimonadales bacterium]|nr:hypothetical protein [Candidatus Saccharimonadales bacterium]
SAAQNAIDAASVNGGGRVYVPPGTMVVTGLTLQSNVWLVGAGMKSSRVYLKNGANRSVITNFVSPDGIVGNGQFTAVMDITIDGNKGNQTSTSHGIFFTSFPLFSQATHDQWFDCRQLVKNVRIINARDNGYYATGRSENRVTNVYITQSGGNNFNPSFDSFLTDCTSEAAGLEGFLLYHNNIMLTACKSYGSGRTNLGRGAGFKIMNNYACITLNGCIAQNNYAQGFLLASCNSVIMSGCISDSNNFGTGNTPTQYAGVEMSAATYCTLDYTSFQGYQNGQLVGQQTNALRVSVSCTNNTIRLSHTWQPTFAGGAAIATGSIVGNNLIYVNGAQANPAVGLQYLPDVGVAAPQDGQVLQYVAASGKWVNSNSPAGTFSTGIFGDASDGARVLDGAASVPFATLAGSTYTMTRDADCTTLTINSGIILKCSGCKIYCTSTLTNNGTIDANGINATGTTATGGTISQSLGGGLAGGNGQTTIGSNGGPGGFGVGAGGAGGAGTSGAGGTAQSPKNASTWLLKNCQAIAVGAIGYNNVVSSINGGSGGSGGGGDGANKGGAGGSGGALIAVFARTMVNNGLLTAVGGSGFTPTTGNCGGGGGGGGGAIFMYTINPWINTATTAVAGGAGGTGVGSGASGGSGLAGNILNVILQ